MFLNSGIWTHNFKSRKSEMGLRILKVAWMQNECLLSIVSENWTHIFKSRKSEKPCMDYWAKTIQKNRPKACSKHVWTLLGSILGILRFLNFFWFFRKASKARNSMEHGAFFFSKKIATKHVQNKFGQFWERSSAFLQFCIFFYFFENFRWLHEHWAKKRFQRNAPRLVWTLGNNFGHFWNFERFLIFFMFSF